MSDERDWHRYNEALLSFQKDKPDRNSHVFAGCCEDAFTRHMKEHLKGRVSVGRMINPGRFNSIKLERGSEFLLEESSAAEGMTSRLGSEGDLRATEPDQEGPRPSECSRPTGVLPSLCAAP
jgi:hypothetical protein